MAIKEESFINPAAHSNLGIKTEMLGSEKVNSTLLMLGRANPAIMYNNGILLLSYLPYPNIFPKQNLIVGVY